MIASFLKIKYPIIKVVKYGLKIESNLVKISFLNLPSALKNKPDKNKNNGIWKENIMLINLPFILVSLLWPNTTNNMPIPFAISICCSLLFIIALENKILLFIKLLKKSNIQKN